MFVCCECCVLSSRDADHSSRGVLPTAVRRCVISRNLVNEGALAHWGAVAPNKKNVSDLLSCFVTLSSPVYSCNSITLRTVLLLSACVLKQINDLNFKCLFLLWRCDPTRVMAFSFFRFLDYTQRRTTVGRTPLDE
jgi:hypothetical protein